MSNWTVENNTGKPLDVTLADGQRVQLAPGESQAFASACRTLELLSRRDPEVAISEQTDGALSELIAAGRVEGCAPDGTVQVQPGSTGPATAPVEGPPPATGDTAEQQGAPSGPPPLVVDREPVPTPPPTPESEPRDHPEEQPDMRHGQPRGQQQTEGGDPVDLFSGALTFTEVDFSLRTSTSPLDLVRHYRSDASHFGPFGWSWDHNHNQYLRPLADGSVAWWTGRLHEVVFPAGGGAFATPAGQHSRLERLPGLADSYALHAVGGDVLTFAMPAGWGRGDRVPLQRAADRHGNALNYVYDPSDRLHTVTDDDGRGLTFGYGDCGLLETVHDHAGRSAHYLHDSDVEHLESVVVDGVGPLRSYRYSPPADSVDLRHRVVAVTGGDGLTFLQVEYDDDPSSWSYGRVVTQLHGDQLHQIRSTLLQWTPRTMEYVNTPSTRVEVLDPELHLITYTFNARGDLLDVRQRLSADRSYRLVAQSFAYDEEGNRVRLVQPDGAEEVRTYDTAHPDPCMRGRLLQRELRARTGFAAPSRIVWTGTYEDTYQLPVTEDDERGGRTSYRYDFDDGVPQPTGRLTVVEHSDGMLQSFEHDARGRLVATVTPSGARSEIAYGAAGTGQGLPEVIRQDVGGLDLRQELSYDAAGNITAIVDATGAVRRFDYDMLGRLVALHAPPSAGAVATVRLIRDGEGRIEAVTRPRGSYDDPVLSGAEIRDEFVLDVLGNVVEATLSANTEAPRRLRRQVDSRGLAVAARQEHGPQIRQCFDERGLLIERSEVGADGTRRRRRLVHDTAGRTTASSVDPRGESLVHHLYDAFGRLRRTTTPTGSVVTSSYGPDDLLREQRVEGDPGDGSHRLLRRTRYDHDSRGRIVSVAEASFAVDSATAVDLVTAYEYDVDGNLSVVEGPHGAVTRFRHDAVGRLVEVEDDLGNRVEQVWAGLDQIAAVIRHDVEPAGTVIRTWRHTHDARGRLVRREDPLGNTTITDYDDRDLPVARIAPDGRRTELGYGPNGERQALVVDAAGLAETHTWSYDALGRLHRYEDPDGQVLQVAVDGLGREIARTHPAASYLREFGADGYMTAEVRPSGARVVFEHDTTGRVTAFEGLAAPGVAAVPRTELNYDGLDRVIHAEQNGLVVERLFDSLGRLVSEALDGTAITIDYNDMARTATRTWPDGRQERTQLDAGGRPSSVHRTASAALGAGAADLAAFTTAGDDRVGRMLRLNLVDTSVDYDAARRVTELAVTGPAGDVDRRQYRFDATGGRGAEHEAVEGTGRTWERDGARRIQVVREGVLMPPGNVAPLSQADQDADIAALRGAPSALERTYTYTAGDERASADEGAGPSAWTHGPGHQLVQAGAEAVSHHLDGARAGDDRWRYGIDALGRVTTIAPLAGGPAAAVIEYDPLGRPGVLTQGSEIRRLRYCGRSCVQEDVAGQPVRQLTPNPWGGPPLAVHIAGETVMPLHDLTGNQVALVRSDGTLAETCRYEPFGRPHVLDATGAPVAVSTVGIEPSFAGLRWLPTVELYLAPSRLYDPSTAAWLQPDPLGLSDGPNPYAYARHNPADLVDPTGELAFLAVLGIMAVGALVGGGLNAARQGIAIHEGAQEEFSWGELALNAGAGAILAPVAVVAPEIVVPLAGMGVANGVSELSEGHYATGTFDIVTSIVGVRASVRSPSFLAPRPARITNLKVTIARTALNQREAYLWGRRAVTRDADTRTNIGNEISNVRLARAILDNPDMPVTRYDPETNTYESSPLRFDPSRDLSWDGFQFDRPFLRPSGERGGDLDISVRSFDVEVKLGERASDTAHKVDARNTYLPERADLPYFLASEIPPEVLGRWQQYPRAVPVDVRTAARNGFDGHIQVGPRIRSGPPRIWGDLFRIDIPNNVRPSLVPQRK